MCIRVDFPDLLPGWLDENAADEARCDGSWGSVDRKYMTMEALQ